MEGKKMNTEETKKEKYKEYICPACGFFFKSVAGFNEIKKCLRCNWTFVSPVLSKISKKTPTSLDVR